MTKATQAQQTLIEALCIRWQEAAHADLRMQYGVKQSALINHDVTSYSVGQKMFHLVIGTSSAFMIDIATGIVYGNKGWLKVDRTKIVGNAYDPKFDAAVLVRDRFRYGRFENNSDGSLKQPIVRR